MSRRRVSPLQVALSEPAHCSPALRREIIAGLPFFTGIPGLDVDAVNKLFRDTGYRAGEVIASAGAPPEKLFVVATGVVKVLRYSDSGAMIVTELLGQGEFFGSMSPGSGERMHDSAQAQSACCVLSISGERFRSVVERNPQVAVRLLDILAGRLQDAAETIRQLAAYDVERRIAHVLLRLAAKFGQPQELGLLIQVPLSREDVAGIAGTTTESASRVLSAFRAGGVIRSGRRWIAIADRERLSRLAPDIR